MAKYQDNAHLQSQLIRIRKAAYVKLKLLAARYGKTLVDLIDEAASLLEKEVRFEIHPAYTWGIKSAWSMPINEKLTREVNYGIRYR